MAIEDRNEIQTLIFIMPVIPPTKELRTGLNLFKFITKLERKVAHLFVGKSEPFISGVCALLLANNPLVTVEIDIFVVLHTKKFKVFDLTGIRVKMLLIEAQGCAKCRI